MKTLFFMICWALAFAVPTLNHQIQAVPLADHLWLVALFAMASLLVLPASPRTPPRPRPLLAALVFLAVNSAVSIHLMVSMAAPTGLPPAMPFDYAVAFFQGLGPAQAGVSALLGATCGWGLVWLMRHLGAPPARRVCAAPA